MRHNEKIRSYKMTSRPKLKDISEFSNEWLNKWSPSFYKSGITSKQTGVSSSIANTYNKYAMMNISSNKKDSSLSKSSNSEYFGYDVSSNSQNRGRNKSKDSKLNKSQNTSQSKSSDSVVRDWFPKAQAKLKFDTPTKDENMKSKRVWEQNQSKPASWICD